MHLFKSSSQRKSKLMRLNVPDTRERLPILHSNTKHRKNSHANLSHTSNNLAFSSHELHQKILADSRFGGRS